MVCIGCLLFWFVVYGLIGLKNGMYWMLIVLVCRVWIDWFEELYVLGCLCVRFGVDRFNGLISSK